MGGQNSVGGGAFAPRRAKDVLSNEWRLVARGRVEVYVPPKSGELDWMDMFNFMRVT